MSDRTPATDALETLGMIHYREEKRDAIHLAVDPVKAGCDLNVNQKIGIIDGIAYPANTLTSDGYGGTQEVPYHDVVDNFLPRGPKEGESFWFVMAPRHVTSLRHVWQHPDFPDE